MTHFDKLRVNGLGFVADYMEEIRKNRIESHIVCVCAVRALGI